MPTVVSVWASWCPPCREELPLIGALADRAGDQLRVLGVITADPESSAESFTADAHVTIPGALDPDGRLLREVGILGPPVTLFIRADGSLAHLQVGRVTTDEQLNALVDQYLGVDV